MGPYRSAFGKHPSSGPGGPVSGPFNGVDHGTGIGTGIGTARPVSQRQLGGLALVLCSLALGGCALQPWVKPYEREKLSDPIMQFSRAPLADKHRAHIHAVREGARGATGVQGGGCGCN